MEFIKKIYNSEYFLYVLLGIIAILIILFLVILFSGRKKRKEEALLKESVPLPTQEVPMDGIAVTTTTSVPLESVPTVEEPVVIPEPVVTTSLDETKEFDPSMVTNYPSNEFLSTNTPIVNEAPVMSEPIVEETITEPFPVSNESVLPMEPVVENTFNDFSQKAEEPIVNNEVVEPVQHQNINNFSSVFIDNGNPGADLETTQVIPKIEEPVINEQPVIEEPVIDPFGSFNENMVSEEPIVNNEVVPPVENEPVVEPTPMPSLVEEPKEEVKLFSIINDGEEELPKLNDEK